MDEQTYRVEVVSLETDEVVRVIGDRMSERRAVLVECGVLHNMDTERFYTRMVPCEVAP